MREVIMEVGGDVEGSFTEIDKLKLSEQRMQQNIDEMQQKFNFIRAKMETKLFSALPDLNATPQKNSPKVITQEMMSPKNSIGVDSHVQMLNRVQKLELATNRLLTDSGKMGEGYLLPTPTSSEEAIAMAQKKQIEQLLKRINDLETLS